MSRDAKTMVLIAIALLFVAARIVYAQESPARAKANGEPAAGFASRVPPSGGDSGGLRADDETTLILATAMVAEAGWDAPEDHAAIAHVLQRRADKAGITLLDMAVRYVSTLRVDEDGEFIVSTDRAQWVRGLNLEARKPRGWPSNLSWSAHAGRWLAVLDRARAFLRGDLPDPCASRPAHWGGAMDDPRAHRSGWVLARCSQRTRNRFWRVR